MLSPVPFAPLVSVPRRLSLLLALIGAIGALAVYAQTIGYGFRWDDYHMVHPWTMKELLRVLHGQWDPTKVEVPFYRPVTDWFYALRFELFGWNGAAQHSLSVLGIAVCAWMTGTFVARETGRPITAAFAAAIYALHPAFIYSEGAWLTNQMHLLASLLVIGALLAWQRVRTKPIEAWWPILLLQVLAFGVKEDTVMLVPVIVALQIARAFVVKDVPYPRWSLAGAGVALTLALPAFRYEMLGKLGGYSVPTYGGMLTNIETALNGIFRMVPPSRPWQRAATAFVTWTPLAALALWFWKRDRRAIDLVLTGLIVAGAFVLPFALVTKVEQGHLVAFGAVITLAGAIDILFTTFTGVTLRTIVGAYFAAGVATFVPISRNIARDFRPCDPYVLETDGQSMGWWITPEESHVPRAEARDVQSGSLRAARANRGHDRVGLGRRAGRRRTATALDVGHVGHVRAAVGDVRADRAAAPHRHTRRSGDRDDRRARRHAGADAHVRRLAVRDGAAASHVTLLLARDASRGRDRHADVRA